MSSDFLDPLLNLEETYYQNGYSLGIEDGSRAGRIEGRTFGLEKGFEKFFEMGRLHGRSIVWDSRISSSPLPGSQRENKAGEEQNLQDTPKDSNAVSKHTTAAIPLGHTDAAEGNVNVFVKLLPQNERLAKHITTLFALTELESLSTENNEDDVSEFDDRFKRAVAKAKVIENIIGEKGSDDAFGGARARTGVKISNEASAERNMEDFGVRRGGAAG